MFSSRTDWDFRPNNLTALLLKKRSRGEEIIDLTETNPTRCGFDYNPQLTLEALATRRSLLYEPNPKGLFAARVAIAEWYEQQGTHVDPEQIIITAGTSEAYTFLFRLLCNPGESVLLPKPGYPLFDYLCRLHDVVPQHYRLQYDGEWHITASELETFCTEDTKALVVIHPNNPTGSFVKSSERDVLFAVARKHRMPLIVDEVFTPFAFESDVHRIQSFSGTTEALTFTLNGLSKLLGLPQMKLAWIVVSGPDRERGEALRRLEMIADLVLSVGTPIQQALPLLLQDALLMRDQILERVKANAALLRSRFEQTSVTPLHCEGGWNFVLRLPHIRTDEAWALELLQAENVLVHPGYLFDFDLPSCMVVSLLSKLQTFEEGCLRIERFIQRSTAV